MVLHTVEKKNTQIWNQFWSQIFPFFNDKAVTITNSLYFSQIYYLGLNTKM